MVERFNLKFSLDEISLPEKDWYASDLFRCEATQKPKPLKSGDWPLGEKIYRDKETFFS